MLEASLRFFGDGHRSLVAEFNDSRQLQEDVRRCKGVKHGRVGGGLLEQTVTINKHRFMNLFLILFYWFKYFFSFSIFLRSFLKDFCKFQQKPKVLSCFQITKKEKLGDFFAFYS